jgi:hypothetical protein
VEKQISLVNVALDDFDRMLADFKLKDKTNKLKADQVVAIFSENKQMQDIKNEKSVTRDLLTHKILKGNGSSILLNYLNLIGILYCASTP